MYNEHGRQYRGMESILRLMARRDQSYLSLWLQWAFSRPNSTFRDEIVMANHASVPVNVLEALACEMLENAATQAAPTPPFSGRFAGEDQPRSRNPARG